LFGGRLLGRLDQCEPGLEVVTLRRPAGRYRARQHPAQEQPVAVSVRRARPHPRHPHRSHSV